MMTDQWNKSSYSNGNGGHCVEARATEQGAAVRDTQNRHLGHLEASSPEWKAFVEAVRR
ncbi:DUF397 domain-containing protein [Nocardiopsis metallicus]|uniref:DUF397 domain-containing protein n=1 Tax=Nocardiopsis metallicus TaxID=179819 RepID=A0A840WI34_9ACTN|nr:DUF397 domain-containing protein [Nocardiopsis metallicus]MBB5495694.1 hypothetical protein [Nocardiopsis metallicus]